MQFIASIQLYVSHSVMSVSDPCETYCCGFGLVDLCLQILYNLFFKRPISEVFILLKKRLYNLI